MFSTSESVTSLKRVRCQKNRSEVPNLIWEKAVVGAIAGEAA